jgi:hypothetical protein
MKAGESGKVKSQNLNKLRGVTDNEVDHELFKRVAANLADSG